MVSSSPKSYVVPIRHGPDRTDLHERLANEKTHEALIIRTGLYNTVCVEPA